MVFDYLELQGWLLDGARGSLARCCTSATTSKIHCAAIRKSHIKVSRLWDIFKIKNQIFL